jgi:hypothetical protein
MPVLRAHRLRAASLALVAALALALLPTLARALQPLSSLPAWADLCRSSGAPDLHHALDACGHCALAAVPALPPRAVTLPRIAASGMATPDSRWAGLPAGPVSAAADARAPPVSA